MLVNGMNPVSSPRGKESRWMGSMSQRVAMLALTTRNVSTEKENLAHTILTHFASRLDSLAFLLKEMQRDAEVRSADYGKLERGKMLDDEVAAMEVFLDSYADKSNLYLLSSCPVITRKLQVASKRLSEALELVLQKAGTTAMKLRIAQVKDAFEIGLPKLDAKQQALLDSLEPEMLDSIVEDPARSNKLVQNIADSLEMPVDSECFARELKSLKTDQASVECGKGKASGLFLDQVVSLLEKVYIASEDGKFQNPTLKSFLSIIAIFVTRYKGPYPQCVNHLGLAAMSKTPRGPKLDKARSAVREVTMRSTPFSPLQSFICPITRDVMRDPVQIASGQTYERSAIERWFSEGHTRCPMGVELKNTKMKSNIALRQSIAEWRERNYDIRIQNAGEKLASINSDEQEIAVMEVQRICQEDNMNKYTITSKGLLVPLIRLAEKQKFELRKKTFATLRTLAQDNDENQDIMVSEGIVDMVVRCLARRYDEAEPAVLLLRLLSGKPNNAEKISHAHGAVLLLVTLLGSEDVETATNVKAILENLPTSDENIVIMAEANLMKPLVTRLVEGSTTSRVAMAKTLAQLQMPETSKVQTATEESIGMLLKMTQSYNEEEKESALGALENLSTARHVCVLMTTAQPSGPEIMVPLITATKTSCNVKVVASRVIANVMTGLALDWEPAAKKDEQVEWLVCTLLQLLNPFAPAPVHAQVLLGLLGVAEGADTGPFAKKVMKNREAFPALIPFLKIAMDEEVKKNAVKIFASLSSTYAVEATSILKQSNRSISNIVEMLRRESRIDQEQVAAVTILANLPVDDTFVTTALLQADFVPLLVRFLNSRDSRMEEAAAGALLRFTCPALRDMQLKLAADYKVIQRLVNLLDSMSGVTKERAARALANFSKNSLSLTKPIEPRHCFQCFNPAIDVCPVHQGECKIEASFCLKEADAVGPLVAILRECEPAPCEAALAALLTLVDDSLDSPEPGSRLIAKAKGVPPIIALLNAGTEESKQMAITLLEKVFLVPEYRQEYGAEAQMHIITVVQRGSSKSKQIAGKILHKLNLLHSQSHYFAGSNTLQ